MLKITRLADYACSIMVTLAQAPEQSWTAVKIADKNRIQLPVTRKILKQLHQKNLLSSSRGAQGGYQLSRSIETISLADIVEAIDGPISLTLCSGPDQTCEHMRQCHTQSHWQRINHLLKEQLSQCSLKELASPKKIEPLLIKTRAPHAAAAGVECHG